jgi:hypothetical protein
LTGAATTKKFVERWPIPFSPSSFPEELCGGLPSEALWRRVVKATPDSTTVYAEFISDGIFDVFGSLHIPPRSKSALPASKNSAFFFEPSTNWENMADEEQVANIGPKSGFSIHDQQHLILK